MLCTAEQIEAKRKLAVQKLAERKRKSSPQKTSNNNRPANPPANNPTIKPNTPSKVNNTTRPNLHGINVASARNVSTGSSRNSAPVHQFNQINNVKNATHKTNASSSVQSNYFKVKNNGASDNKVGNFNFNKETGGANRGNAAMKAQQQLFYSGNKGVSCRLYLVSSERFAVEMNGFSSVVVDVMKTIPSRYYEPKSKLWSFNVNDYNALVNKLSPLAPDVTVEKIPQYVINCCRNKPAAAVYDFSKIDSELLSALMPFQEEGVCFGVDKNGRCLIADDMGLGKTFQALGIASYYKADWPLLIVTTASMTHVWERTLFKYLVSVPIMSVQCMTSFRDQIGSSSVVIVSHDLMARCEDTLMDKGFGVMIIDESHVLKNFKTKCTKIAQRLAKRARRVVLLSGTPALSRPSELYSQLALIDDKFFGTFFDYSKRYCDGKTSAFGWDASGQSNLQELEIVLGLKYMIRRTKEDVLKALPNKTQEVVTLDVNLNMFSEEDRKCLLDLSVKYNMVKKGEKHAALLTFFSETAKIKIPSVCSYIMQILESGEKFLVFAHHRIMLDAIEKVVVKKKKKFVRIDGNTSSHQRKFFVDQFQTDDNVTCAILSITSANAGITLTAAKLVLFAELHWNPSILSQAEARAHRIGQDGHVVIRYLLAPKTADDSIWPLLQNKQKTLKEIGLMRDSFSNIEAKPQNKRPFSDIATDLNGSITSANTLDITSYFSPKKGKHEASSKTSLENEFLNDDFDDFFKDVKDDDESRENAVGGGVQNKSNFENELLNDDLDDVFCNLDF